MAPPKTPLAVRFWRYVNKTDGCWLWTGNTVKGYGAISDSPGRKTAHRASWIIHNGPIPDGLWVLHRCDTPLCVNPEHLWLGTATDNARDREQKGRGRAVPPYHRGHEINTSRLVEQQVRDIRTRYAAGGITQSALAREYGVSPPAIRYIINRVNWHWLPDRPEGGGLEAR